MIVDGSIGATYHDLDESRSPVSSHFLVTSRQSSSIYDESRHLSLRSESRHVTSSLKTHESRHVIIQKTRVTSRHLLMWLKSPISRVTSRVFKFNTSEKWLRFERKLQIIWLWTKELLLDKMMPWLCFSLTGCYVFIYFKLLKCIFLSYYLDFCLRQGRSQDFRGQEGNTIVRAPLAPM